MKSGNKHSFLHNLKFGVFKIEYSLSSKKTLDTGLKLPIVSFFFDTKTMIPNS